MWIQIALPVVVFTSVVLSLTLLVLVARRGLEPGGLVSVALNDRRSLQIPAGKRLLASLAGHGIYLPAACGGRGTCGQCRVRVTSGGGFVTPTEALHLGRDDVAAGMRLACMLKVREPIEIELPEEILSVRRLEAVVESNRNVATWLKELVLALDEPLAFQAGDYVLVEAPPHRLAFEQIRIDAPYRAHWQASGVFDLKSVVREPVTRAYSLANPPADPGHAVLVVKIALPPPSAPAGTPPGQMSSWLFSLEAGDRVNIRGPFGDFHIQDTNREILLIGGGAGISPLRSIALDLLARGTERRIGLWYGARDIEDLCYVDEFEAAAAEHPGFQYRVALSNTDPESGWQGQRGFIHSVVYEQYLKGHPAPEQIEYYLCGPPLMSAAVLKMLAQLGVPEQQIFFDDFGT